MILPPGIRRLALPMSWPPGEVNAWLLEDHDSHVAVDTGPGDAIEHWKLDRPLSRVVVTHQHPDHMGCAGQLEATVAMSAAEWARARRQHRRGDAEAGGVMADFMERHGLAADWVAQFRRTGNTYRRHVPVLPAEVGILKDGDVLEIGGRRWTVLTDAGHSPEHVSLYADGLLISGDQILPRFAAAVSVWPDAPEADPLADYLASLRRYRALPADTLVLPSHGQPFRGLHQRIDAIEAHFRALLAAVAAVAARAPRSAAEILPLVLPRLRDRFAVLFGMGAAVACLNHLQIPHNGNEFRSS